MTTISRARAVPDERVSRGPIRAPRGSELSCKGWQQEAALRITLFAVQFFKSRPYFFPEFFEKHQLPYALRRFVELFTVEEGSKLRQLRIARVPQYAIKFIQCADVLGGFRIFQSLTPFHLLHQESRRHCRIGFSLQIDAMQFAQISSAPKRIPERLVRLVNPRRPLHRYALFGRRSSRKPVGMNLALNLAIRPFQCSHVDGKTLRQLKKLEVILHGQLKQKPVRTSTGLSGNPSLLREQFSSQMRKLSPQPHSSFTFGLLNLKPSFKPSRAKSSSVPSM